MHDPLSMKGGDAPIRKIKILVDSSLKRLARKLRILGLDTAVWNESFDDPVFSESDIFLTKSRRFLERSLKMGVRSYLIKSDRWESQIKAVFHRLGLSTEDLKPFSRCSVCNGLLEELPKDSITEQIPEYVLLTAERFQKCSLCGRVYWRGSHTVHMESLLKNVQMSGDSGEKNPY